ncbi:DUF485 domain-containing protein [Geovibrio thiophilus]|uniref:DUF485 domain-containing protein n=1 Tax=Geovibrio thiophilus TaxID=139438 RepID=A0A410JXT1_9BACT|nr:DUF485 domain-containing protein [Geovibrio thiophilus]QAR32953.1 DUF485 domain-containing protein [Geovibrio thiophilus]
MNAREIVNSDRFKNLVRKRWTFSYIMLAILFVVYFGYLFLISLDKELMIKMVTPNITLGIALFVAVIVIAWVLTITYVLWANNSYDKEVEELKKMLK